MTGYGLGAASGARNGGGIRSGLSVGSGVIGAGCSGRFSFSAGVSCAGRSGAGAAGAAAAVRVWLEGIHSDL
jgi:hypothetical protein